MNNNVNNTGNPSGINFVQGGAPVNGAPVPPQQPVYQTPVQPPVAPAPEMMAAQPQMPQPVNPQPLETAPVNYVATLYQLQYQWPLHQKCLQPIPKCQECHQ